MISFNSILIDNLIEFCDENDKIILNKRIFKAGTVFKMKFRRTFMEKLSYNFAGICISYNSNFISSSITLRNVIELYPIEYIFNIYSPLIQVEIFSKYSFIKYKKNKYYFLRKKPAPLSKFTFNYL